MVWVDQLSGMIGQNDFRRRSNLTGGFALVWRGGGFGGNCLWRERTAVAHAVTVSGDKVRLLFALVFLEKIHMYEYGGCQIFLVEMVLHRMGFFLWVKA